MRRFRRITIMILCAALTVCTLTGCSLSGRQVNFEVPRELDDYQQIDLALWAVKETENSWVEYDRAIRDFEELYPNIRIEVELFEDSGEMLEEMGARSAGGTGKGKPSICVIDTEYLSALADDLLPIEALMQDPKFGLGGSSVRYETPSGQEIPAQFTDDCRIGGNLVALPFLRTSEICYVNETFVRELGFEVPDILTWDYIWEVSEAAMETGEDGTYKINGGRTMIPYVEGNPESLLLQILARQEGIAGDGGELPLFGSESAKILMNFGEKASEGLFAVANQGGDPAALFDAGQCVFAGDLASQAYRMGSSARFLPGGAAGAGEAPADAEKEPAGRGVDPAFPVFTTAVRPFPQTAEGDPAYLSRGLSVCMFKVKDSQVQLGTWLFMQYLLNSEVQVSFALSEGFLPATVKALGSEKYEDYLQNGGRISEQHAEVRVPADAMMADSIQYMYALPASGQSAERWEAAEDLVTETVSAAMRGEETDEARIEGMFEETKERYGIK